MKNPLSEKYSEEVNRSLVESSLKGDRKALDQLIHLHQPFIYNVAWKMVHDPNDAMDLTQEVMIKVITKLSQFNFNSSFRTWLYRIVVNEFLQAKRKKREEFFISFDAHGDRLDAIPNPELTAEEKIEFHELSQEMQIRCMSGMLMCLNREQRLIYVLGDTFGINHQVGADIFNISPQNFRVKLHRARKDLYNFMNNKCGLVNKNNPCRCPKKTKALKKMGQLDESRMEFNIQTQTKIKGFATEEYVGLMEVIEDKYTALFREHPAKDNFDKETVIDHILNDDDLMKYMNFN
jgi:RNA polymerase sigma factor (sigma-70 family)